MSKVTSIWAEALSGRPVESRRAGSGRASCCLPPSPVLLLKHVDFHRGADCPPPVEKIWLFLVEWWCSWSLNFVKHATGESQSPMKEAVTSRRRTFLDLPFQKRLLESRRPSARPHRVYVFFSCWLCWPKDFLHLLLKPWGASGSCLDQKMTSSRSETLIPESLIACCTPNHFFFNEIIHQASSWPG